VPQSEIGNLAGLQLKLELVGNQGDEFRIHCHRKTRLIQPNQACFLFFIGNILHDVLNLTAENPAKHFNGVGADTFVPLQPGDLSGADMVLFD